MRTALAATIGLLALGIAPALAADLPAQTYGKAPAIVAAIYNWSGFYLGANGGWGENRDCRANAITGVSFGCHDGAGGVAGGQVGYRWQTAGWVFGLEAQGDWAGLQGSNVIPPFPAFSTRSNMDAFGLFTGQIGYAWNNALIYLKGGAAFADRKYDSFVNATGVEATTAGYNTDWGGTVGAGFEYGFAPNWSAAVEYDHIFEASRTQAFTTPAGLVLAFPRRIGDDTDLVTLRVNYRFGGPVVAKY